MRRKFFKRALAIILSVIVIVNMIVVGGVAEEAELLATAADSTTSSSSKFDILHTERTVSLTDTNDAYAEYSGFDVTLSSYLDDAGSAIAPMDFVFVLDASTSMVGNKEGVVEAVTSIITSLQESGVSHRIGYVSFGAAIIDGATTDALLDVDEALTAQKSVFGTYLQIYLSTTGGSTHTGMAMERANTLLSESKESGRQQVCILMTDGAPAELTYLETIAENALVASSEMKKAGVLVFCLQMYFDLMGVSQEIIDTFCERVSSYYGPDAVTMDGTYSPASDKYQPDDWVFDEDNIAGLQSVLKSMEVASHLYPFILNSGSVTQDVVTGYFDVSNATYEIQTPVFDDKHNITEWKTESSGTANIDGRRVYVSGFDYTKRCVSYLNSNSARLVIKYHIAPIENFFGGNGVTTNVEGTTSNSDYTTSGSGVYCAGDFLKAPLTRYRSYSSEDMFFSTSRVCIRTKGTPVEFVDETVVAYGTTVDPDDLLEIPDFSSGIIDGTNNAFVNIIIAVYVNGYDDYYYLTVRAGESYDFAVHDIIPEYSVTSFTGDTFDIEYRIIPTKAYGSESYLSTAEYNLANVDDYNSGYVINEDSGIIRTDTLFNATFAYTNLPSELNDKIAVPADKMGVSREEIDDYLKNVTPQIGTTAEDFGVTGYELSFAGWALASETTEEDGTITLNYVGNWVQGGYFFVNVYLMDEYGNYPTEANDAYEFEGIIGTEVNTKTEASYNEYPDWGYHGDLNWLYFYNNEGQIEKLTNEHITEDSDKFNAGINEFNGYYITYKDTETGEDVVLKNTNSSNPVNLFSTVDCYFCAGCGSVVSTDGNVITNEDGSFSWECPSCNETTETVHYTDFELNNELSTTDITISANVAENVINLYFDRCEHNLTVNITNLDDGNVTSYSINKPYAYYISESSYDITGSTDSGYNSGLESVAFYDAWNWVPIEVTPFCNFEFTNVSGFYNCSTASFVSSENFNEWIYAEDGYGYPEYFILSMYDGWGYVDYMPAYDRIIEATIETKTYDLVVDKSWSENITNADKQNCVFGLYEVDENESYSLVTRFVIGADETSKTISGLKAGKTYVLEEETWSYKTKSTWNRGDVSEVRFVGECIDATEEDYVYVNYSWMYDEDDRSHLFDNVVLLGRSEPTLNAVCTNSKDNSWNGGQTVDKGVVNSLNENIVICTPIIKKQEGNV